MINRTFKHIENRNLHLAWRAWLVMVVESRRLEDTMHMIDRERMSSIKRVIRSVMHLMHRNLHISWRSWLELVYESRLAQESDERLQKAKLSSMQRIYRTLQHMMQRDLHMAWHAWTLVLDAGRRTDKAKRSSMQRIARTLQHIIHRDIHMAWQAWNDMLHRLKRAEITSAAGMSSKMTSLQMVNRTLMHIQHRSLHVAWRAWCQSVHHDRMSLLSEHHHKSLMSRILMVFLNRQLGMAFRMLMLHSNRSHLLALASTHRAEATAHRVAVVGRVLHRLKNLNLAAGFRQWVVVFRDKLVLELEIRQQTSSVHLLFSGFSRMHNRQMSKAWRAWALLVAEWRERQHGMRQRMRPLIVRALQRFRNVALAQSWRQWMTVVHEMTLTALERKQQTTSVAILFRGCARVHNRQLAVAWRSWGNLVSDWHRAEEARGSSATQRKARVWKAIKRVQSKQLSMAWRTWMLNAYELLQDHQMTQMSMQLTYQVKSSSIMLFSRACSRMMRKLLAKAMTTWLSAVHTERVQEMQITNLLGRTLVRWEYQRAAAGFDKWRDALHAEDHALEQAQQRKQLVRKVTARLGSRLLAAGWRQWQLMVHQERMSALSGRYDDRTRATR